VLGLDVLGHRHAQVDRHPVDLRVQRELVAGGRDEVADRELLGTGPHLDDHSAHRVAERRVAVEPGGGLLVRRDRTLLGHRVEHLPDLVRARPGLAQEESRASVTFISSVPVEIRENSDRTSTPPARQAGSGTSSTTSSPDR
jgi:hypothetical protein